MQTAKGMRMRSRALATVVASTTAVACMALGSVVPAAAVPIPITVTISPSAGPASGGTLVTISGTGVGNCPYISFGGAMATVVSVASDDSSITVRTPPGPVGPVDVEGTFGVRALRPRIPACDFLEVGGFTYTPLPPPSWFQAIARPSAIASCPAGWNPSWAEWPNGHTGGFVCVREIYWAGDDWSTRRLTAS